MQSIRFSCEAILQRTPEDISPQILDASKWPDFTGFGLIPGIKNAEFEIRTTGIDETWEFRTIGNATKVIRSFELHTKSAVDRHLRQIVRA